jgi:integrase
LAQIVDHRGRRKYLTTEERERFLKSADFAPPRIRALCRVLAYSGCRVSEALALRVEWVFVEESYLLLRTLKRRKDHYRAVPVPRWMAEELLALPCSRVQLDDGSRLLFPMCRQTAWRHVQLVMARAGITGPQACPKGLRHAFGMRAGSVGIPGGIVQRWMGHARPETTAIYQGAVGEEERALMERLWRADRVRL